MEKTFNYQSDANFYDKKDFIIAVLKRKINSFKEYDAERKKHYAGLEQKIGELESYIDELEDGLSIDSLNNKIHSLENKIEKQNLKIKELQAKVNISLFDNTKSFEELESISNISLSIFILTILGGLVPAHTINKTTRSKSPPIKILIVFSNC